MHHRLRDYCYTETDLQYLNKSDYLNNEIQLCYCAGIAQKHTTLYCERKLANILQTTTSILIFCAYQNT